MKSKLFLTCGILIVFILLSVPGNAQTESPCDKANSVNDKTVSINSQQINVSELVDFSGPGTDEIFPSNNVWQPFGPYRTINVSDKQKIVGFGSAVFGATSGTVRISISLCYAAKGNSVLTAFSGNNHLTADVDSNRHTFSVSASGTLTPGSYSVGYCVMNRGTQIINNNDYVNGWLMVIN